MFVLIFEIEVFGRFWNLLAKNAEITSFSTKYVSKEAFLAVDGV